MDPSLDPAAILVTVLLGSVVGLALYVWMSIALAAVFRRLGAEEWRAWVPLLNVATLLQRADLNPWLVLVVLIPAVGPFALLVVFVLAARRVGAVFGYGAGMIVVAALVPVVWATIVGFGTERLRRAPGAELTWDPADDDLDVDTATVPRSSVPAFPFAAAEGEARSQWAPPPSPEPVSPPTAPVLKIAEETVPEEPASIAPPVLVPPLTTPRAPTPSAEPSGPATASHPTSEPSQPAAASYPASEPSRPELLRPDDPPLRRSARSAVGAEEALRADRRPPVRITDDDEQWAPRRSPADPLGADELSGEVSAIAGAPAAGSPRRATSAASHAPHAPDAGGTDAAPVPGVDDRTMLSHRHRPHWGLVTATGETLPLTADVVVLGRRPQHDPSHPAAQLLAVADPGRTVSRTHARMEHTENGWIIVDLGSTNGVLVRDAAGRDVEVSAAAPLAEGSEFQLGDERFRLVRA
ncbi:DUF5684 domain-containing protein [Microbacterium sp. No. 7]|uniref:DUF5684 domain-containing protein n=1 Tax=Microbacterium sp. No. 7 TaxID=1714373 RepID=UPI0006D2A157|nr:DUF5684 domain-containing protein [Microbacterium sp. No. 7]ALJ18987.1 hypothetical protein AOA12_03315 [Microbacterium sp. No. 7]